MKKRPAGNWMCFAGLPAVAALALAVLASPSAQAQDSCGNGSLNGSYTFSLTGNYYWDEYGDSAFFKSIGILTADGNGNISGTELYSDDGSTGTGSITGTYTVNSDCTGTLTLNQSDTTFAPSAFNILVSISGKSIDMIESDGGTIIAGTGRLPASAQSAQQQSDSQPPDPQQPDPQQPDSQQRLVQR